MRESSNQKLGLAATLSVVVGSIIGAGIFMLPISLAPLGWNAAAGWLVSGAGALCIAYALARLTRRGDGIQAHLEEAFGRVPAFIAAWSFWCSVWTANAALAIAAASALSRIDPRLSSPATIAGLAIAFVLVLTGVNALGVRSAGRVQLLTTLVKIVPLLAVIVLVLLRAGNGEALEALPPAPITFQAMASAATLTLFALAGFENATTLVGKVDNAPRNLPIAIVGGTAFVAILYLLSSTAIPLLLPAAAVASSSAPFADALTPAWGERATLIAAACIAVSAFGCLNSGILASGELAFAMARRGDLPAVFARTRADGTPVPSQCLAGFLGIGMILLNASRTTGGLFTHIVLIATVGMLVMYLLGALAAFHVARSIIGRLITAGGIMFALFAFYGAGLESNAWGIVLVLAGLAVDAIARGTRAKRAVAAAIELR